MARANGTVRVYGNVNAIKRRMENVKMLQYRLMRLTNSLEANYGHLLESTAGHATRWPLSQRFLIDW